MLPELLHAALVALLGGANVVIVGDAHPFPQSPERGRDLIRKLLRRNPGSCGGALDLLAMLVGPGKEKDVVFAEEEALTSGDHVSRDGGVSVANVGARVDVVDRGSEIELLLGHGSGLSLAG